MAIGHCCYLYSKLVTVSIIFFYISPFPINARSNATSLTGSDISIIGAGDQAQPSDFPNVKQFNAYLVIQRFKKTLTCDPNNVTKSWVGNRPCTYQGFFCAAPPDSPGTPTIASVDFNGFQLCAPTIAGFVDQLPDLALFHANSNNFTDTIPDLTGLRYFYELDVSNNFLSGPFPTNVIALVNLTFLDFRFNLFSGTVPSSIFDLNLDILFINNNNFSQELPANLGNTRVAYLTLANNGLTGSIPKSISNANKTLIEVLLLNNRLSGCLPYEIGLLSNVTVFDVGFNQITGPIPLSFGCLKKLEQLNLAGNLLYGKVPDNVCLLAKTGRLTNLSLSENYFASIGPSCWELVKSGVLDVRRNCIPGLPEQRPPAECLQFFAHLKDHYCPFLPYIPCKHPDVFSATPRSPAAERRRAVELPPYTAYEALHSRRGN